MKIDLSIPIIFILTISRFISLDADPSIFKRITDLGDEGYWTYAARNKILFDKWITDDHTMAAATAPLYSLLLFIFFKIFSVSLFSSRLLCALAGSLSILLLYFILKRFNRRLAVISAIFLSLNDTFFVYNRIGFPESLILFFLLFSFFFLTRKNKSIFYYFLAGICFTLAIISKLTAIYFFPVFFFYFLGAYVKRIVTLKEIFIYFTGFFISGILILIFYYIPFYPLFEINIAVIQNSSKLLIFPFLNFAFLASNYYFSFPSIFLLLLLSLIYFRKRGILKFFSNIRSNMKHIDEPELIAISWFFGYLFGILFSDFFDRRFTLFIVPLVLFSAMLFDNKKREPLIGRIKLNPITAMLILFPFFNLLDYPASILVNNQAMILSILPVAISTFVTFMEDYIIFIQFILVGLLSILILSLFLVYLIAFRNNHKLNSFLKRYIIPLSVFSLFISLSLNFVYKLASLFDFAFFSIPRIFVFLCVVLLSIVIFKNFNYASFKRILLRIYLLFCIFMIVYSVMFPSFSLKNASLELSICNNSWVIGPLSHVLSLENEIKPLAWVIGYKNFGRINENAVEIYKPGCYLWSILWDRAAIDTEWPKPEQVGRPLIYLKSIELWPLLGKPRTVLELYKIDYS